MTSYTLFLTLDGASFVVYAFGQERTSGLRSCPNDLLGLTNDWGAPLIRR